MGSINDVRRVYVSKKKDYSVEADEIWKDLSQNLGISSISNVIVYNRYDISGLTDDEFRLATELVFSEPPVDEVYGDEIDTSAAGFVLGIESLPGQFNQRADSASQCVQILTGKTRPECLTAKVIVFYGDISEDEKSVITNYLVNPVESRKASMDRPASLKQTSAIPEDVKICTGFISMSDSELEAFSSKMGFAMSKDDVRCVRSYFCEKRRDPTVTELRVLDTYWSDHCRHTTFLTEIKNTEIEGKGDHGIADMISAEYERYLSVREYLYDEKADSRPVCLMDIATAGMKLLRKKGMINDLDISDEINACSINVPVNTPEGMIDYLVMFKNETHNHPTEIEPFGGAATCLGGAIRDPLSGRVYVYQAMRVTGSADPTVPVSQTLPGKLSQRKITTGAASGYSSYGNQIGLATGQVDEIYHSGYMAKRMEIGAVIGAAPKSHVVRSKPVPGDPVILLGGRTGRDGCGGATGSSKEHDEKSIETCGAEVQKGNPPTERKIQRLFRDPEASVLIKKCNDFGAGGVCVAIGELADGISIDLDKVPKKYEGLDGTELAISESQERMAVVVSPENEQKFLELAAGENLEAVTVAHITSEPRMIMKWRGSIIVDLDRGFIDTNGAPQSTDIRITIPDTSDNYFDSYPEEFSNRSLVSSLLSALEDLRCCSRKSLAERFDSSIGAGTILMPYGGKHQLSPENGMAALVPHDGGPTLTATLMSYGFDPYLSSWSPFHGAYYAVVESLSKIAAMGGDPLGARLTFQEYFEKPGNTPERWGKPLAALLGALKAQLDFGTPAIGGKDSMSGTFRDLDVPPTLVSFAVGVTDADEVISSAFKEPDKAVIYFPVDQDKNYLPDPEKIKKQYKLISELRKTGYVAAASVVRGSGLAPAIALMTFGNMVGFEFSSSKACNGSFKPSPGSIVIQLSVSAEEIPLCLPYISEAVGDGLVEIIGKTAGHRRIICGSEEADIVALIKAWSGKLESVFPSESAVKEQTFAVRNSDRSARTTSISRIKAAVPKVFIPVFPGTNCEFDTAEAFRKAGASPKTLVFRNNTSEEISESVKEFSKAISECNILMIPGGFSGGDEPDGSGKFIATAFRNPYIAEEIEKLISLRDGLVLGICNGFQALMKLGLLPFGRISAMNDSSATLTYNTIGRHVSSYVRTKVISGISPWLSLTERDEIHMIPVSHGEGRFIAPESTIKTLFTNGQVATVYVDEDGSPTMKMPYNPNGSMASIEGITSPDGRIFGKMGHSERKGINVAKNIPGLKDQKIFESGVFYFK